MRTSAMRCDLHDGCTLTVELAERTGMHVVEMPVREFLAEWFEPMAAEFYIAEIAHNQDMRGEGTPADANNAKARHEELMATLARIEAAQPYRRFEFFRRHP